MIRGSQANDNCFFCESIMYVFNLQDPEQTIGSCDGRCFM